MSRIKYKYKNKYNSPLCNDEMTFQECEMAILRDSVDQNEKRKMEKIAQSPEVSKIIKIVEDFIRRKKLICYGGTAINNILPEEDQFYNRSIEIPDYDFFSVNALDDAIELANIYYADGYTDVEAKAGVHKGTYKVYVNFIPVADITYLHPTLFNNIYKEAIMKNEIRYAPPNYLRMSMFLELSRPDGDISRWEKVLKRINLLNKHYPMLNTKQKANCEMVDFQRSMENNMGESEKMYYLVRDFLIEQECVFFGGYATSLYSKYMTRHHNRNVYKIPDFDVLATDAKSVAKLLRDMLLEKYEDVHIIHHSSIGEVVPEHYEVAVGEDTVAYLYVPISCHAYNTVSINDKIIRIASIDTMLSFYLAFIYANKKYYNKDRIMCMASYLFEVEQRNRLQQKGLLKRFSMQCYGKQETLEDMRALKTKMHMKLKKNTREYDEWFLKYEPSKNPELSHITPKTQTAETTLQPNITYEVEESYTPKKQTRKSKQKTQNQKRPKRPKTAKYNRKKWGFLF